MDPIDRLFASAADDSIALGGLMLTCLAATCLCWWLGEQLQQWWWRWRARRQWQRLTSRQTRIEERRASAAEVIRAARADREARRIRRDRRLGGWPTPDSTEPE